MLLRQAISQAQRPEWEISWQHSFWERSAHLLLESRRLSSRFLQSCLCLSSLLLLLGSERNRKETRSQELTSSRVAKNDTDKSPWSLSISSALIRSIPAVPADVASFSGPLFGLLDVSPPSEAASDRSSSSSSDSGRSSASLRPDRRLA